MKKVFEEAENVEHAMMNMLHNAWNVNTPSLLTVSPNSQLTSLFVGLPLFAFAQMVTRQRLFAFWPPSSSGVLPGLLLVHLSATH